MKRTQIGALPFSLPRELAEFAEGARIFDSSCSPEARVYFLDKGSGYYLKSAAKGSLKSEMQLTDYFHSIGLGPRVVGYHSSSGRDLLVTERMHGEDCTHPEYLGDPKRLCDTIAQELRALHERDPSGCPAATRTREYVSGAFENYRTGNFDTSHFPDSFGYSSPEEAIDVLTRGEDKLEQNVLIHGDYCLPNIMLDGWRPSGFIDLGNGGIADRHIDLFWGIWTLEFNLGTDAYRERFIDAYGRELVDEERLRIVAAAEVFG